MLKTFIETNRQAGTTRNLVKLAEETGGYLVVSSVNAKERILKDHPNMLSQIITYYDIKMNKTAGIPRKPIFFDTDVVALLDRDTQSGGYSLGPYRTPYSSQDQASNNFLTDGYDGYLCNDGYSFDAPVFPVGPRSYCEHQFNIKLTEEDMKNIAQINKQFFENEASNSMLGRILIRKGIAFYQKLNNT